MVRIVMFPRFSGKSPVTNKFHPLTGMEQLEPRRILDCHGLSDVGGCLAGDSDGNGQFDQHDLIQILQANKYLTGEPATWEEGDWNRDGVFDQLDVVTAQEAATYRQGELLVDLSSLVRRLAASTGPFGPPFEITSEKQLNVVITDASIRDAVAGRIDFRQQKLLLFSWSGSGGDQLWAGAQVVEGQTHVEMQFQFGLTDDLRPHQGLFAVPQDARWHITVEDSQFVVARTLRYELVADESRLLVSGGFAGVQDEYRIEGHLVLTRNEDGTAHFSEVEATLHGDGLSSLDGRSLDSVLNLSGLSGLQTWESTVAFSGFDISGSSVMRFIVHLGSTTLQLRGGNSPPCCDFFQYEVDATGRVIELPGQ